MANFIGRALEDFTNPAFVNGELTQVSLNDIKGKWSLFFFYPGDFTFVCPTELEDLANNYSSFQELECEIYAISTDSEFVHKAWHDASESVGKVKYPMVSDRALNLSTFFEVLIEGEGQSHRGAFIINPEGEIAVYEISAPGIGRNAKELLRKVRAAQFVAKHGDKVCPANWEPGDDTLTPGIDLVGKI